MRAERTPPTLLLCALCAAIALLLAVPASGLAARRYASPNATRVNGACPQPSPCRIDHAVGDAGSGDEVILAPGDYVLNSPLVTQAPISLHGADGQPRPRLLGRDGGATLELRAGGYVKHLYLEASGDQDALVMRGGLGEDLIAFSARGRAATVYSSPGASLLRDSVLRSAGPGRSALQLRNGGLPGPIILRNLTAIASGSSSRGISSAVTRGGVSILNTIARGQDRDIAGTSSTPPAVGYSNFRTSSSIADQRTNQSADPVFVDLPGGNLAELATSPTIDAGVLDAFVGSSDPNGNARYLGGGPDIGAYEFLPAPRAATGGVRGLGAGAVTLTGLVAPSGTHTTYHFDYGAKSAFTASTPDADAGSGSGTLYVDARLSGLARGTTYQYRLVAVSGAGRTVGATRRFTTPGVPSATEPTGTPGAVAPVAPAVALPPPAPPVLAQSFNLAPTTGDVVVRPPDAPAFVPVAQAIRLEPQAVVDARRGAVRLTTAHNSSNLPQSAVFAGSIFKVTQSSTHRPITTLRMRGGSFRHCPSRRGKAAASAAGRRIVRRLWGSGHGRFRTVGRYSAASVRGTIWLVDDRCDGTMVTVFRGRVAVRDFVRHRTVYVSAGHAYLARAPRHR